MNEGRRGFLARAALAPAASWLSGCGKARDWADRVEGRWIGNDAARGHRVRAATARQEGTLPAARSDRRVDVLVVGAGIAGLAAARALRRAGIEDFALLELEDDAGGNSRGHAMRGLRCPLGAHYLPLPGPHAIEVQEWLVEIGAARPAPTGLRWDERQLCHSPQERLFIDGHWQDGLLPQVPRDSATQAQYRRFADLVARTSRLGFAIPTARASWSAAHAALDGVTFAAWLRMQGIVDAKLLTYLDYCCRDDYGAGSATVSAWAGVHYFASRHGFEAPGDESTAPDALLTWPEGNARLAQALRAPLGDRVRTGRAVWRIDEDHHGVEAWAFTGDDPAAPPERWRARRLVLATPLFIAARLSTTPSPALREAAARLRYAPWLVANLRLDRLPLDRQGAPLAWDNVIHGSPSLGYVDAQHQSLAPVVGDRLWTAYRSFAASERARLLGLSWQEATRLILDDLRPVHPDLADRLRQVDLIRHGHAMSIPVPGVRSNAALAALSDSIGRVHFAHSDLSGYSVFEEAFTRGDAAGRRAAAAG